MSDVRDFRFVLKGVMPLLMHSDSIDGSDELKEWRRNPDNKNVSTPGDDRSPAWTWQTYLYTDGGHVTMPAENLMVALRQAGGQMILKGTKTFKQSTQTGLLIPSDHCDFFAGTTQVAMSAIHEIRKLPFGEQAAAVRPLGFDLFIKRAPIGKAKHIRVRPRFRVWSVVGTITVSCPEIDAAKLSELFHLAGKCGLCDWRPACRTPGVYGQFTSKVTEL